MTRIISDSPFHEIIDALLRCWDMDVKKTADLLGIDEWKLTKMLDGEMDFPSEALLKLAVYKQFPDYMYLIHLQGRCKGLDI